MFSVYILVFIYYINMNIDSAVGECFIDGSPFKDQNADSVYFHDINKHRCVCRSGFVISRGFLGRIGCYVGECSTLTKCEDPNTRCTNGKCLCNRGYLRYNGFRNSKGLCQRGDCLIYQYPCFDKNAECVRGNNICRCKKGFITAKGDGRNLKCQPGDCSASTASCNDKNAKCLKNLNNGIYSCQCVGASTYVGGNGRNVACVTSAVSNDIVRCKYEIIDGTCKCPTGFVKISGTGNNIVCQLGQCLESVAPCLQNNSECVGTRCICKFGFHSNGGEGESLICSTGCFKNAHCFTPPKLTCDTTDNTCKECIDNGDCTGDDTKSICDANTCVECTSTSDNCGDKKRCNANVCVCDGELVESDSGACVECLTNDDCSNPPNICDIANNICEVFCITNDDCFNTPKLSCDSTNSICKDCSVEILGQYYWDIERTRLGYLFIVENGNIVNYHSGTLRYLVVIDDNAACSGTWYEQTYRDRVFAFTYDIATMLVFIPIYSETHYKEIEAADGIQPRSQEYFPLFHNDVGEESPGGDRTSKPF